MPERLRSEMAGRPRRKVAELINQSMSTGNPVTDRKIQLALEGLANYTKYQFLTEFPEANKLLLAEFLNDSVTKENIAVNTKRIYVNNLLYLSRYLNHKAFKEITRDDVTIYLQTLRRPLSADPMQRWISTHNLRLVICQKFFKWLNYPDLTSKERPTPEVVRDLRQLRKKERTPVKARDLWTEQEDSIFLKYCDDPRIALFHIMSLDTSARPHELLTLRIGDVKIKQTSDGKMYGEVEVGRGGKTKSRTVPLIVSLPYYKAWLARHPEASNPAAFIFRSIEVSAKYRNIPLKPNSIHSMYWRLKYHLFPRLLDRPDVSPEDKIIVREMLQKPWNPYLRRHISLTAKARLVNEYTLRLHAGWTKSSQMVEVYTHELGGESSRAFLEAAGIFPKEGQSSILQPKLCPMCNHQNRPEDRFCSNEKCGTPLSFDAFQETKDLEVAKDKKVDHLDKELGNAMKMISEQQKLIDTMQAEDQKHKQEWNKYGEMYANLEKTLKEKGLL